MHHETPASTAKKTTWEARIKTAAAGLAALFAISVLWTDVSPLFFLVLPWPMAAFFTICLLFLIPWGLKLLLDQQREEMEASGTFWKVA